MMASGVVLSSHYLGGGSGSLPPCASCPACAILPEQYPLPRPNSESVSLAAQGAPKRRNRVVLAALGAAAVISVTIIIGWHRQAPVAGPTDYVQLTDVADSATAPALSPDGRLLAFIRNGSAFLSAGQIWLKALPDGEPVQLTHESGLIFAPTFTSDGTRVAYSVAAVDRPNYLWNTWTVATTGGEPEQLLPNASGLTFIGPHGKSCIRSSSLGSILELLTSLEDRARSIETSICLRMKEAWRTSPICHRIVNLR